MSHRLPAPGGREPWRLLAVDIAALAALSLALNLWGLTWGLPNGEIDWSNDSIAPMGPLSYARHLLTGGSWSSKYPPFHFMVLAAAYAPYLLYLQLTGGLVGPLSGQYPYGFADSEAALMTLTLIARAVSALMGTGVVVVSYLTVRRLFGRPAAVIAGGLIPSCYPFVHYAHNANIDVPQLFWISLALYSFVRVLETGATRHHVLLGLFMTLAVGTKDSAYALGAGLAACVAWRHLRARRSGAAGPPSARALVYGGATVVVATLVVFNVPFNWEGFREHVALHLHRSMTGSRVIEAAPSAWQGEVDLLARYLGYLVQCNGPLPFALLALGAGYTAVRSPATAGLLAVPVATYYLLFLRVHPTQHIRYVLPVFLLLAWQAGKLGGDLLAARWLPKPVAVLALGVVLTASTVHGGSVDVLYARDPRYAAERWMEGLAAGATVLAVQPDYTLPRFLPHLVVTRRQLWDWNGTQIGDFADLMPDYVVIGTRHYIPGQDAKVERAFRERGYREEVRFKSPVPAAAGEVRDLHAINPRIVVFKRTRSPAAAPLAARERAR